MTPEKAYADGRLQREIGLSRSGCPIGTDDMRLRHWWLAGWHDRDMELAK